MAAYRPDPAQVFASDVHRRVAAALPAPDATPLALEYAVEPILDDENIPFHVANQDTLLEIKRIVEELAADGFVTYDEDTRRVQRTAAGGAELDADVAYEVVPPLTDEEVAQREAENEKLLARADVRAAESRIAANETALTEIQQSIEADQATIAAVEASA